MNEEIFKDIQPPVAFSRRAVTEIFYSGIPTGKEQLMLGELERQRLDRIIKVLNHPELQEFIENGKITLGAIKPRTQESKLGVTDDIKGERMLLGMIKPPLEIVFSISLALSPSDVEDFYPKELKNRLMGIKDDDSNAWERYKNYMLSGPITYFLLYDTNGNAVEKWRDQMGATDPQEALPDTIRGQFALFTYQNLVHGSSGDTDEEKVANVRTEVSWLKNKLELLRNEATLQPDTSLPTEEVFREVGIITDKQKLVLVRRFDFYRADHAYESYLACYAVTTQDESGKVQTRYIAQKAIVSFGSCEEKAKDQFRRFKLLESLEIKTPKVYGIKGADIFEEYIVGAKDIGEAIKIIKSDQYPRKVRENLLSQLVRVAAILDKNGFSIVSSFYPDLIFNGKDLYFVDTGFNLGEPDPANPSKKCKESLTKEFKDCGFDQFLEDKYSLEYGRAKRLPH